MAEERSGLEAAVDELLKGKKAEEIAGPNGLLKELTKARRPLTKSLCASGFSLAN